MRLAVKVKEHLVASKILRRGEEFDAPDGEADLLILLGIAEKVTPRPVPAPTAQPAAVQPRSRYVTRTLTPDAPEAPEPVTAQPEMFPSADAEVIKAEHAAEAAPVAADAPAAEDAPSEAWSETEIETDAAGVPRRRYRRRDLRPEG